MVTGASPLILWQCVGTRVPECCPRGQPPRRDGPMQLRIAEEGRLASKLWKLESIDENADQCTPTLRQLWEGTRRTISAMLPVVLTLPGTPLPSETIIDASIAFRRRRTGRSPGCATCRPGSSVPSDLIAEAKHDHGAPRLRGQVGSI